MQKSCTTRYALSGTRSACSTTHYPNPRSNAGCCEVDEVDSYDVAGCRYLVAALLDRAVKDAKGSNDGRARDAIAFIRSEHARRLYRELGIDHENLVQLADRLERERTQH